ncbi:metal-dependent hydrolase [Mangrovibacillus cuniculi]|uniref:Metal-dependent hydrolase n=1 Tax=Mangrovibacillus cuniculi TaxID=2593652 RepID=A0A7S8C9C4_9BACI|nr:metal-dependent hydrolase [Mangrovibacillus cuniculi]QPC45779.1 metal-dependent hydrolase [Mangrovibacillus cuniculi]
MDTATHITMGIALGGIATLDPTVATSSTVATAVMFGTVIGSQIPDIDTVLKLRNNAIYIRHHRGITHSIPAVLLWPIVLSGIIFLFFPSVPFSTLWLWTFLAVFLHVFVDIFNAYGTQALRPFSKKWVAIGVINTFDWVIFLTHLVGIFLWYFGAEPGPLFIGMYCALVFYYLVRFAQKLVIHYKIKKLIPDVTNMIIAPTMGFTSWRLAIVSKQRFYVGRAENGKVEILDEFLRKKLPKSDVISAAKVDPNLSAFLSFSPLYRWVIEEYNDHYEVRFIDLRYRSNDYYPFVAVVKLDEELNILSSYTGWIFSEEKLKEKLKWT